MKGLEKNGEFGHICVLNQTNLNFWTYGTGKMSGGMTGGGAGIGIGDGGRCQRRESGGFQEGRVSRGWPEHPRVKMKIDMHIVTRESKILTHGLNEKNPTIMYT